MNGRQSFEDTNPESRIAAVARSIQLKFEPESKVPDFADYRDAMSVFVRKELILARIDEARKSSGTLLTARIAELASELAECEKAIPHDAYFPSERKLRESS